MITNLTNPFFDSRLLLVCEGISYAHIARSLIVARWLKSLNHQIIVACPDSSSALFISEEFETVPLKIANPLAIYRRLRQGGMMYETEDLLNYFQQDDLLLKQIQPHLIISEFRFTILQLAKKYGIPSVGMTEATCHPNFTPDGTVPDPFAKPRLAPLWLLDFISQRTKIGQKINQQIIQNISTSLREASVTYDVEVLPTFFDYASQGDLCLICDHPDLIPIHPLRPGDIYTGALLWERPESLPPELSQLDPNKKTIYISLGTQESLATNFVEDYAKKLIEQGLQVIVSCGNRPFKMVTKHKNLYVYEFVNDSKLLNLVDLMVYPGGAMSTYQAIASGVSLIALPAHANQHFYAEAIVRNKLGYMFRPSRLKINTLVAATLNLLNDPGTQESTKRFQQKMLSLKPQSTILNRIESLIK